MGLMLIDAQLDRRMPEDGNLASMETVIYGAAPITPNRLTQALDRFGHKLVQVYGQTECVGVTTSLRREEHDPPRGPDLLSSCGRPTLGTSIRITNKDGHTVPDGTAGELCVRWRAVMSGYRKLLERTHTATSRSVTAAATYPLWSAPRTC